MLPTRTISILPGAEQASLNGPVLAVSIMATIATGIVFGLLPAWQVSRPNLEESLKEGSRANTGSLGRRRLLGGLIALEYCPLGHPAGGRGPADSQLREPARRATGLPAGARR